MQTSATEEIRWRYNLYRNVLSFCQQGQFSFARFLALVPDRLRLAVGESVAKTQIPVSWQADFVERCGELLPSFPSAQRLATALAASPEQLRRAIRLAQIDGNLDVVALGSWLTEKGEAFFSAVGRLYAKGLREVGHGEGGEETAFLVQLLVLRSFRSASEAAPLARGWPQALVSALLNLALEGALNAGSFSDDSLSARLGFQFAVVNSPLALGASETALLQTGLNAYRTSTEAVELMRRETAEPVEKLDLNRCIETVARHLLARPPARTALARELLYELVRDCILLAVPKLSGPHPSHLFKAFHQLASSSAMLAQHLTDPTRREQLIHWIDVHSRPGEQPLPTLRKLLTQGEQPLLGSTKDLRVHGDLKARAELAATGALVFLLDQRVEALGSELLSRIRLVGNDEPSAYEDGRCYRLAYDDRPLYQLPKIRQEALLFVDLKDFTQRTAAIKEQAMGDFLKRFFYDPIFQLAAQLKGQSVHALSILNILGDAVAFRGEIEPIVSLALGIRRILSQAQQELTHLVPEVLGGSGSFAELDGEIARVKDALSQAEARLQNGTSTNGAAIRPAEQRKRLAAQLAMLEDARQQKLARTVGLGLEAGAYISFGAAAEKVDLNHPSFGPWTVSIGERLNEAARGTSRSALAKARLDARIADARRVMASPELAFPFQVRVDRTSALRTPPEALDSLEAAIFRADKNQVTDSVRQLARWLQQVACDAIDREESTLPNCLSHSEEFYNAGCSLSASALNAFQEATRRTFTFEKFEVYRAQLPEAFHRKYLLDCDPERFLVAWSSANGQAIYLFRYAGKATFKGFEKQAGIEVWELMLPDLGFGRDLIESLGIAATKRGAEWVR